PMAGWTLGIPDEEFEQRKPRRGLITKAEVRVVSLAKLCLRPDSIVWDIGPGSGSVAIEAARIACRGRVYAIEKNPEAYRFLLRNIERNRVSEIVDPHLGDCREVAGAIGPVADRVLMGYLHNTISFLPHALGMLSSAGGIVHIHSLVVRGKEGELAAEATSTAEELGYRAKLLGQRVIKSYSPSKLHIALDIFALKH
ncbi:MAG: precorrin-6Y C5,15-methyltransferase (decarboxylating) subunit CbiT, partial [Nitrososphaerota archaeon]